MDMNQVMLFVIPFVKTFLWLFLGLGACIGLAYYLFVIKRRRVWEVNLWEKKADGRLHFIGKDRVIERKINKGKNLIYILKKARVEVFPPPWETTYRLFGKEYTDYLRLREDEYQPAKRSVPPVREDVKYSWYESIKNHIKRVKTLRPEEVEKEYIHVPLNNTLVMQSNFESMDYDVNMMRINAIDNRDKIYADVQTWAQQYGFVIAVGAVVVLIIVVLYMSYGYSETVLQMSFDGANKAMGALEQVAQKIGGTAPPV